VASPQNHMGADMNGRKLKVPTIIAGILALGEFGSAVTIWQEKYPGSLPWAAVVFGVFFGLAPRRRPSRCSRRPHPMSC
jgi:hypothetical protein